MRFWRIFLILLSCISLLVGCTSAGVQAAATPTATARASDTALPTAETRSTVTATYQTQTEPTLTETLALPLVLTSPPTVTPSPVIRFAVIGDYGTGLQDEGDVAALVDNWQPDFVITTGDNNYPSGASETIDAHIGQFYHAYIYPYLGTFSPGADVNRFFPSLGNHDWDTSAAQA